MDAIERHTFRYVELKRKWGWLHLRATMTANRPADTATPGDDYEKWYREYCDTDRLDPLPQCCPGTYLWREMARLAARDNWPVTTK